MNGPRTGCRIVDAACKIADKICNDDSLSDEKDD